MSWGHKAVARPQSSFAIFWCKSGSRLAGSLPEHPLLQTADQPGYHLLQLRDPSGTPGQEDHRVGLLMLLHPLADVPVPQESSVPRLPSGSLPVSGFL